MHHNPSIDRSAQPIRFEEALSQLERIVKRLESGAPSLNEAIDEYMQASELKKMCYEQLTQAKMKVESLAIPEHQSTANEEN